MISINNLSLSFGSAQVLKNISFSLKPGRPLAVIGESGAGKSSLALTLMGMSGGTTSGSIVCDDFTLTDAKEWALRRYRGHFAAMVVQHLADVLNPQIPILEQVIESALAHRTMEKKEALTRGANLLEELEIPRRWHGCYPKQFSGGQVQRIMLAMALINDPSLLILDEPTAALDPATKEQFLASLSTVMSQRHVLLITHDLEVAEAVATETAVLYGGSLLEQGETAKVLRHARHPYTRGLIRARPTAARRKDLQGIPGRHQLVAEGCVFSPRCTQSQPCCFKESPVMQGEATHRVACHRGGIVTLLEVRNMAKNYGGESLLQEISLQLWEGETVAIVGKSGSGKSTLVRMIMGLEQSDSGAVLLDGCMVGVDRALFAAMVGFVSQHPKASMSPRFTLGEIVGEPLVIAGGYEKSEQESRLSTVLDDVQLPVDQAFLRRRPDSLSGGELQRLAIARALVRNPKIVIADEPTSALDLSVQAKIMKLLLNLQEQKGLSLLLVTHDIDLAYKVADRILLLEGGTLRSLPTS